MTEKIIEKLDEIVMLMHNLVIELDGVGEQVYDAGHYIDTVTEAINWMESNVDDDSDIYVQIYAHTPRGHKIYETTSENILSHEHGDYIIMLDSKTNKVEMINRDCVYKIILDSKEDK